MDIGRSKELLQRWGYLGDNSYLKCECGTEPQTTQHLLECPLLEQTCTARDLAGYNDTAYKYVQHWLNRIWCLVDSIRRSSKIGISKSMIFWQHHLLLKQYQKMTKDVLILIEEGKVQNINCMSLNL